MTILSAILIVLLVVIIIGILAYNYPPVAELLSDILELVTCGWLANDD